MKRHSLIAAFASSIVILGALTYLHVSPMSNALDPDAPRSPAGPDAVMLTGDAPAPSQPAGVIIPPPAATAPATPLPSPTPVYDEIRESHPDEAYDHLYSVAFDARVARRHLRDFDLIARDAGLPEELRRLAVWGLAQGGDLESIRSQLADGNAPGVELAALEMLRRHEGAAAFDLIAARAREAHDPRVREAALRSLGHMGGSIDFRAFLPDEDASVRAAALELLSDGEHEETVDALLEHAPSEELETVALARALSARGHSPEVIARIDELAGQPALSPEAARSIALSRHYAEHPELTAAGCSGSH